MSCVRGPARAAVSYCCSALFGISIDLGLALGFWFTRSGQAGRGDRVAAWLLHRSTTSNEQVKEYLEYILRI